MSALTEVAVGALPPVDAATVYRVEAPDGARSAEFEAFVRAVMESWRANGGEPDVGLDLPRWLGVRAQDPPAWPAYLAAPGTPTPELAAARRKSLKTVKDIRRDAEPPAPPPHTLALSRPRPPPVRHPNHPPAPYRPGRHAPDDLGLTPNCRPLPRQELPR